MGRALRLGLGVAASAVAVAVAARATMARRAAIGAVPEDLRHPILFLPRFFLFQIRGLQ